MQVEISAQTDTPVDSPGDVTQVLLKGHCADCK
jgi:hypothetical protein